MQDQKASAPQIVDLDRDRQRASSSVLLTPRSVATLPPSSSSPLPDAPLAKQKRASRRAQRPSTSNLNPITAPSSPSHSPIDSSTFASCSSSYSDSFPHHAPSSSRRDPDLTTDSLYKGLRPKSSFHQSLLNLREDLQKPSDSGVYPSLRRLSRDPYRALIFMPLPPPARCIDHRQLVSLVRLIWRPQQSSTLRV
jgi:hypothetical protein